MTVPASAVESSRRALRPATFVLLASKPVIRLGGSLLDSATDEGVRSNVPLVLSLSLDVGGDRWLPLVGMQNSVTRDLLAGIAVALPTFSGALPSPPPPSIFSNSSEAVVAHPALELFDWSVASKALSESDVKRVDDRHVEVHVPPIPFYRPQVDEFLSIVVPAGALRSGRTTLAESLLVLGSGSASARLSGPLLEAPYEGTLQSKPTSLVVTLSGATFHQEADLAVVLAGIRADGVASAGATGFNAQLDVAVASGECNVTLLSPTVVIVHLPPLPGLRLSEATVVTVRVPAASTAKGHRDVFCNPQLVLRPRRARLSGSLVGRASEVSVRALDNELIVTLEADSFSEDVGNDDSSATAALLAAIAQTSILCGEAYTGGLTHHHIDRLDATQLRISVYSSLHGGYHIDSPETLALTLPALTLQSNVSLPIAAFIIAAVPGTAEWYPAYSLPGLQSVKLSELDVKTDVIDYETRVDIDVGTDRWVSSLGEDNSATRAFLQGFISSGIESAGWNRIVRSQLSHTAVERVNDHRVLVRMSGFDSYDISQPETVRLMVPHEAVVSGQGFPVASSVIVVPTRGSAALSGTLLTSPFEKTMQSVEGGRLYFTLIGDGFVDTLGQTVSTDDACTGTLIDQLTLAPGGVPQPLGWEAVVQATLRSKLDTVVVRESRNSLLIQLPQLLIYKLSLAETITAAIPGACLESGNALQEQHISGAPFRVLPAVGRAYLSGSLLTQAFESTVQSSSSQLLITVQDDSLSVSGVEALVPSIISGSLGTEPGSWMSIVQASLSASNVAIATKDSGFDITIDIPPNPAYAISQPETVQVVIPASMLSSEQSIIASPAFVIEVAGATGTLVQGSLADGISEESLRSGELQNLTIELAGDGFKNSLPSIGLLEGLVSGQAELTGWTQVVRPTLSLDHFTVISNTTMGLYFRAPSSFDIFAPETM